jgi:phenylacetate-CoA ligase
VEARPESAAHEHEAEAGLLAHKLKAMIGISAHIKVQSSGSLQRSSGKASRVTDRR